MKKQEIELRENNEKNDGSSKNGISRRGFLKAAATAGAFALVGSAIPRVVWADDSGGIDVTSLDDLINPNDIAVMNGELYIVNSGEYGVIKLDGSTPTVLGKGPGSANGYFNFPMGVCALAGGVAVADTNNNRIQLFDFTGDFYQSIGRAGYLDGQFLRPKSVAVYGSLLAVVDTRNHRVQIIDLKSSRMNGEPNTVAIMGGEGDGENRLKLPYYVAFDSVGDLHVIDKGHNLIKVFDIKGKFIRSYGSDAKLNLPEAIAFDGNGNTFVADTGNHTIKLFAKPGKYKSTLKHKQKMERPRGLAISDDMLYVADPGKGRVFTIAI